MYGTASRKEGFGCETQSSAISCGSRIKRKSGDDSLIAAKVAAHTDDRTTANIYNHVQGEMMKKAAVNLNEVFRQQKEE